MIEDDRARLLIEVDAVVFVNQKTGWVVYSKTLPEKPLAPSGLPREPTDHVAELDDFWIGVTPVGGRLEDLSKPISEEQYRPMPHDQEPI